MRLLTKDMVLNMDRLPWHSLRENSLRQAKVVVAQQPPLQEHHQLLQRAALELVPSQNMGSVGAKAILALQPVWVDWLASRLIPITLSASQADYTCRCYYSCCEGWFSLSSLLCMYAMLACWVTKSCINRYQIYADSTNTNTIPYLRSLRNLPPQIIKWKRKQSDIEQQPA